MVKKIIMKYVLNQISKANDLEIQEIVRAIIQRYSSKFPDWEIIFLSLPKNDSEYRRNILHSLGEFLERHGHK